MHSELGLHGVRAHIDNFARMEALTRRFRNGAPRNVQTIGDGRAALFLRSNGSQDTLTSLWMSVFEPADADNAQAAANGATATAPMQHREVLLADPRDLLADADDENVPAEEKRRRERAREAGSGVVSYSVDASGHVITFTLSGRLFVTTLNDDFSDFTTREITLTPLHVCDSGAHNVVEAQDAADLSAYAPILNPRMSPDGTRIAYSTGMAVVVVDVATGHAAIVIEVPQERRETVRVGLAEFVAGEEMDRYDGFWWAPDSDSLIIETYDAAPEPQWVISAPAFPEEVPEVGRYARALTHNARVALHIVQLGEPVDNADPTKLLSDQVSVNGGIHAIATARVDLDAPDMEYVAAVSWMPGHRALILVQNRLQQHDRVLQIEPPNDDVDMPWGITAVCDCCSKRVAHVGTRIVAEHHNDQWIDLVLGTPSNTPDGRLVCALNDMEADTNRLTIDDVPFTPVGWNVREVLDVTDDDVLCIVQRNPKLAHDVPEAWRSHAGEHDARSYDVARIAYDGTITPVSTEPGVWSASRASNGYALVGHSMTHALAIAEHHYNGHVAALENYAAEPGFVPNVRFTQLGERGLYTAIVAPSATSRFADASELPVLMKPYGGPGFQQVTLSRAAYLEAQWWADQGFLVVIADGRGTTGRGPRWDREIYKRMKDVTLADQVAAVEALPLAIDVLNRALADGDMAAAGLQWREDVLHEAVVATDGDVDETVDGDVMPEDVSALPKADLERVAIIGWSYGGYLSALAVLEAPQTFAAACAGAPPTDWTLYDTHYTERYLGLDPDVYEQNNIIRDAAGLERPLMLIHGFADDNVTIAHSLRLSQALMTAGKPHTFLPLTGITHMTNDPTVSENLLTLQRDFLHEHLQK